MAGLLVTIFVPPSPALAYVGFAGAVSLIALVILARVGLYSAPFLCGAVLFVFHFGAIPAYLLDSTALRLEGYPWLFPVSTGATFQIASVCFLAFAAGALLTSRSDTGPPDWGENGRLNARALGGLGTMVLLVTVVAWVVGVLSAGVNPLSTSYLEFLGSEGARFTWLFQPIGLGFTFAALAYGRPAYRVALATFGLWAIIAFFLGFRGEVLFPAVAHLSLLRYKRTLPSPKLSVVLLLALLILISLGREVRDEGITARLSPGVAVPSPVDALTELGSSIRVVETFFQWHELNDEKLLHGSTYWAPVDRQLVSRLQDRPNPAVEADPRLLTTRLKLRVGPIGGSIIGEAYINFGASGAAVLLGAVGGAIGLLTRRARESVTFLAFSGIAVFAFMWHVRNDFVPIPLQVTMASALAWLAVVWSRLARVRGASATGVHASTSSGQ